MITLLASAARVAAGSQVVANVPHLEQVESAAFQLDVSAAAAAAGDTLNVYVQRSIDGGTTWDDFLSFTQVLGNGGAKVYEAEVAFSVVPETETAAPKDGALAAGSVVQGTQRAADWRIKWAIANAVAPSFTFSIKAQLQRARR